MFTLISVDNTTKENTVKLELNGNPFLPRDFDTKKYFKYQLIIHGLRRKNEFLKEVSKFVDDFIDIEELEDKKLDFWSDGYQIGEFEFEKYEEIIEPFEKKDWISEYKSLIEYYYQNSDNRTKDYIRWRKLIDNLEVFLNKEIGNYEVKSEFLADNQEVVNSNKKAIELANKIQNLIEQYKIEEKENGS
jgi:hypothetical protein